MDQCRISWITGIPVTDGNWKSQVSYATLDELKEALRITKERNETQKGQKSRITALEREIKKKNK